MAHHAFVISGGKNEVVEKARSYAARHLSLINPASPDIHVFSFGLFSVEDARNILDTANQSAVGDQKVIIVYATRLFHEAQNALLKVFEEPPAGVTLILGIPSLGILLPTLRSRLQPLPGNTDRSTSPEEVSTLPAESYLSLMSAEREKYIAKLIDRSKADKDETKQEARNEANTLIQSLTAYFHAQFEKANTKKERYEHLLLLQDLTAFAPLMHERSVPLKLIFEHLLLVIPTRASNVKV